MKIFKLTVILFCILTINAATFPEFLETQEKGLYYYDHQKRYVETYRFIEFSGIFDTFSEKKILELGSGSPILSYLKSRGADTSEYTAELRETITLDSGQFDAILLLEVFEHLKDIEGASSHNATQCFTGPKHLLSEIHRILKPGSFLILTTPNVNSLAVLHNFFMKEPPYNYHPHPREYTKAEVLSLVRESGFEEVRSQIIDVWNLKPEADKAKLLVAITEYGADISERGDDMMFIFRKL